jgi:hypothetical protein
LYQGNVAKDNRAFNNTMRHLFLIRSFHPGPAVGMMRLPGEKRAIDG